MRPSCLEDPVGNLECMVIEPLRRIEQQYYHFGEIDRAAGIGNRQFLQLFDDVALLAHSGSVDQSDLALFARLGIGPQPVDRDRIAGNPGFGAGQRSEEHTSELQSLMRSSYAVFCLKKKKPHNM